MIKFLGRSTLILFLLLTLLLLALFILLSFFIVHAPNDSIHRDELLPSPVLFPSFFLLQYFSCMTSLSFDYIIPQRNA